MTQQLETPRLLLRTHRPEDLESHTTLLMDREVMHYLDDIRARTKEEARQNLEEILREDTHTLRQRTLTFFRIEERETGAHVGEIGYTMLTRTPMGKLVQLGYFTHTAFWSKGYVTEALEALLQFAFTEDDVYRITTGCLMENVGSRRVLEKCGFIKEAEHLEYEWLDGAMRTRLEYRLLLPEYPKK